MPRPPRPGLTSQPSDDEDIIKANSGHSILTTPIGASRSAPPVTVDAENGLLVNNPALAGSIPAADEDRDDEHTSLLGKPRKLVSGGGNDGLHASTAMISIHHYGCCVRKTPVMHLLSPSNAV